MRLRQILIFIGFLFSIQTIKAQVGIGTTTPSNSAILHLEANNKGVIFPRMTALQRSAIPPVNGLIVFDLDSNSLYIYQIPSGWKQIKALSSLKDLITGNTNGDVLLWNGTEWVITPLNNLFSFFYRDKDADGLGDKYLTVMAITAPEGYVANNNDCNDDITGVGTGTWYRDEDADGYGTTATTIFSCTQPGGYVSNGNDCNDNNAAVNPNVTEIPTNGIDDDCDGLIDEGSAPDLPDDSFTDSNGDGIDGTEFAAVFVSSSGNDANPGTKTQPKRLITAAISTAVALGKTQVYVGDGTYAEKVILQDGISVYGGYSSANWSRSATNIATIYGVFASGRIVGIEGTNISSETTVDRLTIFTSHATSIGTNNYGMYCNNCDGIILKNSNIQPGNGGVGSAGGNGSTGQSGSNGVVGNPGSCDGQGGSGGGAGTSPCARPGGAGGNGGGECSCNGATGGAGTGGTLGGAGGAGCDGGAFGTCAGNPGNNGSNGTAGGTGSQGSAGSGGTTISGFWVGDAGGNGSTGIGGNGGGGGGGGGGQGGTVVDDGGGNGGGGGGAGGCGGTGGLGGSGGGGSFGIFLFNSTGIQLISNTITSGNGGSGGVGGARGIGGGGGNGEGGAFTCTGEVGRGGNGGNGGTGGAGGYGGGGAGGVSYSIYRSGTTVNVSGNTLSNGSGGTGGISGGNSGINGASGQVF